MKKTNYIPAAALLITLGSAVLALPAFAESNLRANTQTASTQGENGLHKGKGLGEGRRMMPPGVRGSVTAISGATITVSSPARGAAPATTYTIDASGATIMKNGIASTLSAIAVGDTIMANGTLTGTSLVAKNIFDGQMPGRGMDQGEKENDGRGMMPAGITGSGQPLVGGAVTSVTGSTIVITNKSAVSYTIDATNAKFTKVGVTTPTVANIVIGDTLLVQGAVNGTAVTATSIIDQGVVPAAPSAATNTTQKVTTEHRGFFGGIGHFFSGIFGF